MRIITGNSNPILAKSIAKKLKQTLVDAKVKYFADREIFVEIAEQIRGEHIFLVQSTSYPANDHLMELMIIIDALKRSFVKSITAVIPYFGYARQDRQPEPRTPISAKVIADMLSNSGIKRILTVDLHSPQIEGFFNIPVDNITPHELYLNDIKKRFKLNNLVIVSPDIGGVVRSRILAKELSLNIAVIDKRREKPGFSQVLNIIGDVNKKDCIIVDDIVDSARTLCNAAEALIKKGAKSVTAYITHGVLSNDAVKRVEQSLLSNLVITDCIYNPEKLKESKKIKYISIAPLLAEVVKNIYKELSA